MNRTEKKFETHKELTNCPECDGSLTLTEPVTSDGSGKANGIVECGQCGWRAEELWKIEKTVALWQRLGE